MSSQNAFKSWIGHLLDIMLRSSTLSFPVKGWKTKIFRSYFGTGRPPYEHFFLIRIDCNTVVFFLFKTLEGSAKEARSAHEPHTAARRVRQEKRLSAFHTTNLF